MTTITENTAAMAGREQEEAAADRRTVYRTLVSLQKQGKLEKHTSISRCAISWLTLNGLRMVV